MENEYQAITIIFPNPRNIKIPNYISTLNSAFLPSLILLVWCPFDPDVSQ